MTASLQIGGGPRIILRSPWGYSSAGRALAWHARGQRFDPAYLHHCTTRRTPRAFSWVGRSRSPSSRGLGHYPFTVGTRVRIPLGTPASLPSPATSVHSD